jgi:uncharacterized coiled-coil protein SlyX
MATTFADLEARVRGLESRAQRTEEDVTAIVTTVVEIRDDVRWLKQAVQALLADRGLTIEPDDTAE